MSRIKRQEKNKFEKGLINAVDDRDIPEEGLANATNLMCDIQGKVRQMGIDSVHQSLADVLDGNIEPGYGLFPFNSDRRVHDNAAVETKMLAIQDLNNISIYDTELNVGEVTLGPDVVGCKPVFYYSEGCLRVNDANFENTNNIPKTYRYIEKKFWATLGGATVTYPGDWYECDAYCFPPSISGTSTSSVYNIEWGGNLEPLHASSHPTGAGNICLSVEEKGAAGSGSWMKDSDLRFGISFTYEGNQESPITEIPEGLDTSGWANDDYYLEFTLKIDGNAVPTAFDPRITGCTVWWTGNANGQFANPWFLFETIWVDVAGAIESQKARAISHEGTVQTMTAPYAGVGMTNALKIEALPVATYSMLNPGQLHGNKLECAEYKTATIINRRCFIGNIRQFEFDRHSLGPASLGHDAYKQPALVNSLSMPDRMISSPIGKYDIFDEFSVLDTAVDDGDHIVAITSFGDRLLQFKTEVLYVINVAGDADSIESEHRYMGLTHPYQYTVTEYGVCWVNKNGCYMIDKEGVIVNLIDGLIDPVKPREGEGMDPDSPEGWAAFMGNSGMVGYLPEMKQLIVFEDPINSGGRGNIMVFDFTTQSWTRGIDRVTALPKSNIVTNYDDKCLYTTQEQTAFEKFTVETVTSYVAGTQAQWTVENLAGDITTNSNLCQLRFDTRGNETIENLQKNSVFTEGASTNWVATGSGVPAAGFVACTLNTAAGDYLRVTPAVSTTDKHGVWLSDIHFGTGNTIEFNKEYAITFKIQSGYSDFDTANFYIGFGDVVSAPFNITTSAVEYTQYITPTANTDLIVYMKWPDASYTGTGWWRLSEISIKPRYLELHQPFEYNPTLFPSVLFRDKIRTEILTYVGSNELYVVSGQDGEMVITQLAENIGNLDKRFAHANGAELEWKVAAGYSVPIYIGTSTNIAPYTATVVDHKLVRTQQTPAPGLPNPHEAAVLTHEWSLNDTSDPSAEVIENFFQMTTSQSTFFGVTWVSGALPEPTEGQPYWKFQKAGAVAPQDDILQPAYSDHNRVHSDWPTPTSSFSGGKHILEQKYYDLAATFPCVDGSILTGTTISSATTETDCNISIPGISFKVAWGPSDYQNGGLTISMFGDWTGYFDLSSIYYFSNTGNATLDTALSGGIKFQYISFSDFGYPGAVGNTALLANLSIQEDPNYHTSPFNDLFTYFPAYNQTVTVSYNSVNDAAQIGDSATGIPPVGSIKVLAPDRQFEFGFADSDLDGVADSYEAGVRYSVGISGQDNNSYVSSTTTTDNQTALAISNIISTDLASQNDSQPNHPWQATQKFILSGLEGVIISATSIKIRGKIGATGGLFSYIEPPLEVDYNINEFRDFFEVPVTGVATAANVDLITLGIRAHDIVYWKAGAFAGNTCIINSLTYDAATGYTTITIGTTTAHGCDGTNLSATTGVTDPGGGVLAYAVANQIEFSSFRMKSRQPTGSVSSLDIGAWVTKKLTVREFINNEDSGISGAAASSDVVLETPDYILDESPSTNKKLYKVSITYKCSGNFKVTAGYNARPGLGVPMTCSNGTTTPSNISPNTWNTDEWYFNADRSPRSLSESREMAIKSVRIKIRAYGAVSAFQINDITIYYRPMDRNINR